MQQFKDKLKQIINNASFLRDEHLNLREDGGIDEYFRQLRESVDQAQKLYHAGRAELIRTSRHK